MNKNEVKRMFRLFTIADFDKEEKFLRNQHKAGFKCVRYQFPGFYYFEKCEPEDVIYQLDFAQNVKSEEKNDYLQIYKDTGWEYMFDAVGWSYFRKSAGDAETDSSIYTDKETKIELVEKIFKTRMLPLVCIFLCCIIPQLISQGLIWSEGGTSSTYASIFVVLYCVLFLVYLIIFIRCGGGLYRLKKDYENGVR